MTFDEKRETLSEIDEDILLADGFEDALIGHVQLFNQVTALYDRGKCLEILMSRDGLSQEEAEEFFETNVTGAFVGEKTPAFATLFREEKGEKP